MEIIDTPTGERLRFTLGHPVAGLGVVAAIQRDNGNVETLVLDALPGDATRFVSNAAPAEPHEFSAFLRLSRDSRAEELPFQVVEPAGHAPH